MKKKLFARMWLLLLTMIMVFSLIGCGANDDDDERSSKKNKTETSDEDEEEEEDDEAEPTPEPTATPVPDLLSEADKANFDQIVAALAEVDGLNQGLYTVIDGCYVSETTGVEDIGEYASTSLTRLEELQKNIDGYNFESKSEDVLLTHAAAKKYIAETVESYRNLYNIQKTHTAALEALSVVSGDYGDAKTQMEAVDMVYGEFVALVDALKKIDYPAYMEQPVESMIESYDNCRYAYAEVYWGYSLNDSLRVMSGGNTLNVLLQRAVESAYQFDEDVEMQCYAMYNRLNERLNIMACEIESAVTLMSDNKPISGFSYLTEEKAPEFLCDYIDTIFPALYNSEDYVVCLSAICEQGDCNLLIEAEIEGFSQKYSQKITLGNEITKIYIKPAILSQGVNLNSQKTTQLKVSVTDLDNNKIVMQETKNITLMSLYDLSLEEENEEINPLVNTLAWVTPEADEIRELKRIAIDNLPVLTEGYYYGDPDNSVEMNALVGYQPGDLEVFELQEYYTKMQVLAIQCAMSDMGIAYNMSAYSSSDFEKALQRVLPPADTINTKSGVCIETALVMASALQSANMHCMLVFPPNHCQVAVEIWNGTGEYLLIETTTLPVTSENLDYIVTYMDKDEWAEYVAKTYFVIDCNMAPYLNLTPVYY